jgi:phage/plasmid-associated DNA primase
LGYAFTGLRERQVLWVWRGGGQNGKSELVIAMNNISGKLANKPKNSAALTKSKFGDSDEAATPALFALCQNGTRSVFYPETSQDSALCAEKIKPMVDDAEKTTTRALYSGCRELVPRHTTFLMTNPAIVLDNADDATMRRIFQFLFEAIFRKIGAAQAKLRWDEGMERNTDPEWLRTNFKADKQWVDQHIHSESWCSSWCCSGRRSI